MNAITPRWEWRSFGEHFGNAEVRLKARGSDKFQHSDEIYLLSSVSDANVKIRDGLMDIKRLELTDTHGFEQWRPILKEAFPLPAAVIGTVFSALGVMPPPELDPIKLDQLLAKLASDSRLRILEVHKSRTRYQLEGCMAELTEVAANGKTIRTIAVESEEPAHITTALRTLGLQGLENISYPRALKRLVEMANGGFTMPHNQAPRYATIDIGTNSIKFHIGERLSDGTWRKVIDRAEVVRLGEGLRETGVFNDQAMARASAAITNMAEEAQRNGVTAIAAVATMGMRNAGNADQFIAAVLAQCGVSIEVISGEEEARLAYLAVQAELGLPDVPLVVFDSGGGSTQFTFGHGSTVDDRFSLNVGAARFTERYSLNEAVDESTLHEALAAISADLARLDTAPVADKLIGMGGAVTNMVAVKLGLATYDPDVVQGAVLTRADVEHQIEQYRSLPAAERQAIIGLQPGRAEVILAGACIVKTVLEKFRMDALTVSDRSLRHGLLIERFSAYSASIRG